MMRNFLCHAAFALLLALSSTAKSWGQVPALQASLKDNSTNAEEQSQLFSSKVQIADNQRIVGLYTTDEYATQGLGLSSYPGNIGIYSSWPAKILSAWEGTQLSQVRFALTSDATIKAVTLYGIKEDESFDILFSDSLTDFTGHQGWNTVTLSSPWTIQTKGYTSFRIGYTYVQTSSNYPLSLVHKGKANNVYGYGTWGNYGTGFSSLGSSYGNLSVQAIVEGNNLPANAVTPQDFDDFQAVINKDRAVDVTFINNGNNLKNFAYTVTVNGQTSEERQVDLGEKALGVGGSFDAAVNVTAPSETGTFPVTINVTKVNGKPNEASITSATGNLTTISKEFKRNVVVEEFTGTGCGWCPRGLIGMRVLGATFPDTFIGIAIHQYNQSDPMFTTNYKSISQLGISGAPSCVINRNGKAIDPYYGSGSSITDDFNAQFATLPVLGVQVDGAWNADSTKVEASATVDPLVSGNYNIDFVLTADSLTGINGVWSQNNYYSRYSSYQISDPNLSQFCEGGRYGSTYFKWPFDDVLIASSYIRTTNQAVLEPLVNGTPVTSTYELTIPTSNEQLSIALHDAILDGRVNVIAIVYNKDGILNADKIKVRAFGNTTGITNANTSTNSDNTVIARYNAAGQRISTPQRGINILRLANGKTVKVIEK